VGRGGPVFNKECHDFYLLSVRETYDLETAAARPLDGSRSSQFEECPSSDASPGLSASSYLSPNLDSSDPGPAANDGNSWADPLSTRHHTLDRRVGYGVQRQTLPPDSSSTAVVNREQVPNRPSPQAFELNDWVHDGVGNQQAMNQNGGILEFAPATSPSWEPWTCIDPSTIALPNTNQSDFPLEELVQLDSSLNYDDEFGAEPQPNSEHDDRRENSQPQATDSLDTSVERITLEGAEGPKFTYNGQTGEDSLLALLRSELEAELYPSPGYFDRKRQMNRGLRSPAN